MSTRALTQRESDAVRRAIRHLIDECGSQVEAARRIGISQQSLSSILGGSAPGMYTAKKIAHTRRMSLADLLSPLPGLDALISAYPDRWRAWTISAVRVAPEVDRLDRDKLERLLDRVEDALSPVVEKLSR